MLRHTTKKEIKIKTKIKQKLIRKNRLTKDVYTQEVASSCCRKRD